MLERRAKKAQRERVKKAGADAAAAKAAGAAEPPQDVAQDEPARPHAGSNAPRPRAARKLTPDSLKALLPHLDGLYLKWKSNSQQVQVEFTGTLHACNMFSFCES